MSSLTSKGYTPCEYIESSGSQYIDTGFKPNQNTRVVMDVWVLQNNSAVAANELFGARTSTSSKAFAVQYNASNTRLQFLYNNGISYETKSSIYSRDLCDANKNSFSFYGASISRGYATFQCDYNLYLLALNNAGVVAYQAIARLYSCQVYDNDTLIRDFKPCRNSSGVYGLFDEVNDVFYTTPSGSFTGSVAETSIKLSQSFRRRLLTISNNVEVDYEKQYFTIEALESGTISWGNSNLDSYAYHIYYSKNGGTWYGSTTNSSVTVVSGDKVRFKTVRTTAKPKITFGGTAKFNVYGNIMSLIHEDGFVGNNTLFNSAFERLFESSSVVDASNLILPATTLADYCYNSMFNACHSLITAPELPAITLAYYCYYHMFSSCSKLTTAPKISATKLAISCCHSMFNGCSKLTTAPELPATVLATGCYSSMFDQCTSLTTAPSILPATTLASTCYDRMFYRCTSLTTAPKISATKLASSCCDTMFGNCTSLTKAPKLPATTLASDCYYQMFVNCTSLTTAPELPATTLAYRCYYSMFQGCYKLTTAPELPAHTLADYCYQYMFDGCRSLNHITMLAINTSAYKCLEGWVFNVSYSGTFVKDSRQTSLPTGDDGIPEGWTVQNSDGSPVTGGESTTVSVDWTVQEGNWNSGYNTDAWSVEQYTSVSPGSNGSARLRCTFSGVTSITFNCVYNGENNYDYLTVGNLDSTCTRSSYGTSLQGKSGTAQDITFSCDSGTHYVEFCYSKDSSVDTQPDCAVVYIKNCS